MLSVCPASGASASAEGSGNGSGGGREVEPYSMFSSSFCLLYALICPSFVITLQGTLV